ncbi:hypothetical protein [Streptomyces poonensis]|uniref:Lipoprotein n=1 Tax=Streptomyces poonensis TaxID=68255 RepID=A0A918URA3_9ACTN|nr:hypothetical protein [Streptomyces poonensis]GGZ29721.1 hypothetical protein GCM10010365_57620 [Streptomyces poonensis]
MRRGLVAVAVLAVVMATACDGGDGRAVVVEGTPPATPYGGPLEISTEELDESTPEALHLASGAAGRALECEGEIFEGNGPDGWNESDGGRTPEEGLRLYFDMFQPEVPRHGYRVERRNADRVLYSFDVDGRTKVAVVVARDQKDRPGWGPETSASCDPAELPAESVNSEYYEIWTDEDGRRQPVSRIHTAVGPEHCDWQEARFLYLGRGTDGETYVRDPEGVLDPALLNAPYHSDVSMPADAHDTGYRYQDWQLWLTDDRVTAYVRTSDGIEAWPSAKDGMGCM